MRFFKKAVTVAVIAPIIALGVATSAQAAPQRTVVSASTASSLAAPTSTAPVAVGTSGALAATRGIASTGNSERLPIGPLIQLIKRFGNAVWNACVSAVRAGWAAFQRWWNDLASWIRWTISQAAQMTVWEIFVAIWNYIF